MRWQAAEEPFYHQSQSRPMCDQSEWFNFVTTDTTERGACSQTTAGGLFYQSGPSLLLPAECPSADTKSFSDRSDK